MADVGRRSGGLTVPSASVDHLAHRQARAIPAEGPCYASGYSLRYLYPGFPAEDIPPSLNLNPQGSRRSHGHTVFGLVRNIRRNLPIWISSPWTSAAESTGSWLT